jgi:hydrogenase-1 operon protein HyaF
VRHALRRLLEHGEDTVIDLRAIPMAPGEEVWLEKQLGRGEVIARLDALGPSEIRETAVAAVWLVIHRNAEEEEVGKFIEVTRCPAILQSQTEDMHHGLRQLEQRLGELDPSVA